MEKTFIEAEKRIGGVTFRPPKATERPELEMEWTIAELIGYEEFWATMIGLSAILDVIWWLIWGMLVYIKTNDADSTMKINSGGTDMHVPLNWLWDNLGSTNPLQYTAIQYLFVFIAYGVISLPELILWMMYLVYDFDALFIFKEWASVVGLYIAGVVYFFPVLFPIL